MPSSYIHVMMAFSPATTEVILSVHSAWPHCILFQERPVLRSSVRKS
jgi:hypothetical protein